MLLPYQNKPVGRECPPGSQSYRPANWSGQDRAFPRNSKRRSRVRPAISRMGGLAMTAVVEGDRCWRDRFGRDGYAILDRVIPPDRVAELIESTRSYAAGGHDGLLDRRGEVYG